jgi:hypothetical protein
VTAPVLFALTVTTETVDHGVGSGAAEALGLSGVRCGIATLVEREPELRTIAEAISEVTTLAPNTRIATTTPVVSFEIAALQLMREN